MAHDHTTISWTDATWSPTTGCDRVSPGCDHCYALTMAGRLKAMGQPAYQADGDPRTSGPGFALTVHPDRLDQPLRWREPRRVFVDSMSDLFHPRVPVAFLVDVFVTMGLAEQHTFQILTKRPARMRSVLTSEDFRDAWYQRRHTRAVQDDVQRLVRRGIISLPLQWPLPNVWLGVSVEDQERADQRVPDLVATPATVRFISAEPLLEPVTFRWRPWVPLSDVRNHHLDALRGVHWVIIGGESGPGARPMHADWARQLVEECRGACRPVAVWVKQLGSISARTHGARGKGEHLDDLPEDLRIREFPAVA